MDRLKIQETESMECIITDDNSFSPLVEEPNGHGMLKKGPWTPAEDALLEAYVNEHGEGNWNAVQLHSGLSRCGKSCRLRWVNHLRPNLKKGAFTQEEEDIIIRLHAKLGNKWARMANELPGRTDNEIKNFWNTRIKRLHRAGQPIYPADVEQSKKSSETQQSQMSGTFSGELTLSHNLKEADYAEIPPFEIPDSFLNQINLPDILTSNMLPKVLYPSHGFTNLLPAIYPQKRLRESDTSLGLCDTATSSLVSQMNGNAPENSHHQSYEMPHMVGSYHSIGDPSLCFLLGSHALVNGNPSTSEPDFGSEESELPSLQISELDLSFHNNAPPLSLTPLECDDTQPQFPLPEPCQVQYNHDTDGSLESVVWPQNRVKSPEIETDPKEETTYNLDCFSESHLEWDPHFDWDTFLEDPIIGDGDFPLTGNGIDEPQPTDAAPGNHANTSDADPQQHQTDPTSSNRSHLNPSKPNTLLNAILLSIF